MFYRVSLHIESSYLLFDRHIDNNQGENTVHSHSYVIYSLLRKIGTFASSLVILGENFDQSILDCQNECSSIFQFGVNILLFVKIFFRVSTKLGLKAKLIFEG